MTKLLDVFPFIKKTMTDLEQQNKFLNKVTLTGKINALDVAANLFEFTDKTAVIFDELKVELIDALLQENINKIVNELSFKSKTAIDILIRNLYERTADVGFFATDSLIINYLTNDTISDKTILKHLQEYAKKYSVYNEIIIFDTQANVKINLNPENPISASTDSLIQETLSSDSYIERFETTDIFKAQDKTLTYTQKIVNNGTTIGVLCLCFKFEDELKSIFSNLSHNQEVLSISNAKEFLVTTPHSRLNFAKFEEKPYSIINSKYISVTKKTSGYQGYRGIEEWFATASLDTASIKSTEVVDDELGKDHEHSKLLSDKLKAIIVKANDIIEDISDVIINGELIASKQKVYVLTPILDNLRNISTDLLSSIKHSIKNLEYVVEEGLVHDVKMASHLAMDIMDRNLYERANDCRWWALTPSFIKELQEQTPNQESLTQTLTYINDLYTVYTDIFIYNHDGKIVASSKNSSIVGTTLKSEYIQKSLSNSNSQKYFVSPFENSSLSLDNATYIYSASINSKSKILGGIGIVFDASPEFEAMLHDSFPENKKGFMVFLDNKKRVISSSNPSLKILDTLEIDDKFVSIKDSHSLHDFILYDDVEYMVASVKSTGYREYKRKDNYKNEVYCLTFVVI